MQFWLHTINGAYLQTGGVCAQPLGFVLNAISEILDKIPAGYRVVTPRSDMMRHLASVAKNLYPETVFPDRYRFRPVNLDRQNLQTELKKEIDLITGLLRQDEIEFCLPVKDWEMKIPQLSNFLDQLQDQDWLTIYVIMSPTIGFRTLNPRKNLKCISEALWSALDVTPGIPEPFLDFLINQMWAGAKASVAGFKEKIKPSPYRKITENYEPQW